MENKKISFAQITSILTICGLWDSLRTSATHEFRAGPPGVFPSGADAELGLLQESGPQFCHSPAGGNPRFRARLHLPDKWLDLLLSCARITRSGTGPIHVVDHSDDVAYVHRSAAVPVTSVQARAVDISWGRRASCAQGVADHVNHVHRIDFPVAGHIPLASAVALRFRDSAVPEPKARCMS